VTLKYLSMKFVFYSVGIWVFISCNENKIPSSEAPKFVIDGEKIQETHNKTLLELYISNYVDSINNIRDEKQIPHF
jgi:hypothetical protein